MPEVAHARARARRWAALAVAVLATVGLVVVWVVRSDDGPVPPFLGGARIHASKRLGLDADASLLHLAGSGSNLPITRALVEAMPPEVDVHPVVHPSIGSGGGLRALLDGVVDIALVSRPLAPTERELGLVETPYARVPIIVAVNDSVPDTELTSAELLAIYRREKTTWSDGSPILVLQREPGDSSHRVVDKWLKGFADANAAAHEAQTFRVLYLDDDMRDALAATAGAIGLFGAGAIPADLPIHALVIDGLEPTVDAVHGGRYPLYKDLAFVTRGPPTGPTAAVVGFAHSEDGREIIRTHGGVPIGGEGGSAQ